MGAGDVGIRPVILGNSPFAMNPTQQKISFLEGNNTISITSLDDELVQSEVNASGGELLNFSSDLNDYSYELNVTNPSALRIAVPYGAVEKDGNFSQAVAFEFNHRVISAVEDGLLAWYDLDNITGGVVTDKSGRMRHANIVSIDATDNDQSKIEGSSSHLSPYSIYKAFDNDSTTANGRWLARRVNSNNSIVDISVQYNFESPTAVSSYQIVSQHWKVEKRSPKSWTIKGSNDNSTWNNLDRVTNQINWGEWEARNYPIPVPGNYQYYKIVFDEATGNDRYLGIAEIKLFPMPNLVQGEI